MNPILSLTDRDLPYGAPESIPLGADQVTQEPERPPEPAVSYEQRRRQITAMLSEWKEEEERVKTRRKLRKNHQNVEELREEQKLLDDETIIADHTIDSNIAQEKAAYMQYLETSRTLLTFTPRPLNALPRELCTLLEEAFTLGARYDRWKIPWYKIIDSTCLHGCSGFEVVFDLTKPMHFAIDYIRREHFIYPKNLTELERCDMLLRVYEYPISQFESWMRSGESFNKQVLGDIVERYKERRNELIKIYKVYIKEDGIVKSGWYCDTQMASNTWLKEPAPHHIGLVEERVTPIDPALQMLGVEQPPPELVPVPCTEFLQIRRARRRTHHRDSRARGAGHLHARGGDVAAHVDRQLRAPRERRLCQ
jgi:hypothetical protein